MLTLLLLSNASTAGDAYDAMVHAWSIKDPAPVCAQVEALAPDPVPVMRRIVGEVPYPAWVAIRVADCLVTRHGAEIEGDMTIWMADPHRKGLGLVALDHLDDMEPALAARIASAAMAGPYKDAAATRIARSRVESVRILATP